MRIHPVDGLLFLLMKLLKSLDRRGTGLAHFDPEEVKSILVVSSTAIGDTLLSTPAIRAVRERYPQAAITGHFNVKNVELFENNPHIDGIIPYYGGYRKFLKTVREFRRRKFDLVLIFHGNEPQATPMAYLSGARFIIKLPRSKEYGFLLSNTHNSFDNPWDHHAVELRLRAASFAGCREDNKEMVLPVEKEGDTAVVSFLNAIGIREDTIIIGFQVGAATRYKMWPERNFIALGRKLLGDSPAARIVVTGSRKERGVCDAVARAIGEGALSLAGEIPLRHLPALVKRMRVLVTNDTGTMHIAIALRTRTVSLFCPTNHWGVGPLQDLDLHRTITKERPCDPCVTKRCNDPFCMEQITVDEVYETVKALFGHVSPSEEMT